MSGARTAAVRRRDPPPDSLIGARAQTGDRVDGFTAEIDGDISLQALVERFYNSPAFRPERWLLSAFFGMPSSDDDVAALASGARTGFAAWTVEARNAREIILRDFLGFTRSWLMAERLPEPDAPRTRLWFGTAFAPGAPRSGLRLLSFAFHVLRPFHEIYSRALLGAAIRARTNGERA